MKNKRAIKLGLSSFLFFVALTLGQISYAADPTLKNVNNYFTGEVQIAIGIVALILCIVFFVKQKIGAVIGVVLASAFIFFMANDPQTIFNSIGGVFKKVFGG